MVRQELGRHHRHHSRGPPRGSDRRAAQLPPHGRRAHLSGRELRRSRAVDRRRDGADVHRGGGANRAPPLDRGLRRLTSRRPARGLGRARLVIGAGGRAAARRRADHDLHVGDHGPPEGSAAPRQRRPSAARGDDADDRLRARRRLHHDRSAVPQRSEQLRDDPHGPGQHGDSAASLRCRGLAASVRSLPRHLHLLGADADAPDPRLARRRATALRRLEHADHARERGTVAVRAQATLSRLLSRALAVGRLRRDRDRHHHAAPSRGSAAQARAPAARPRRSSTSC